MSSSSAPMSLDCSTHGWWRCAAQGVAASPCRPGRPGRHPDTVADPSWAARGGSVGSSPEHWSGHSSFSAAAATTLAGFFCSDQVAFTLVTDSSTGGASRTYPSFSAAAVEAGRSRVLGGLHFEFSNQAGLAAGAAIAEEVLSKALLPRGGATPGGDCPR